MIAEIKSLHLDEVITDIARSKNTEKIVETNKSIEKVEELKPKNCNCDLFTPPLELYK